jgi:predicted CXXCH cytochrome family protein
MLLAESKQALCMRCHEGDALKTVTAHGKIGPAGCIACHNPHMGKTASLLRSDYDELLQNYNGE